MLSSKLYFNIELLLIILGFILSLYCMFLKYLNKRDDKKLDELQDIINDYYRPVKNQKYNISSMSEKEFKKFCKKYKCF